VAYATAISVVYRSLAVPNFSTLCYLYLLLFYTYRRIHDDAAADAAAADDL